MRPPLAWRVAAANDRLRRGEPRNDWWSVPSDSALASSENIMRGGEDETRHDQILAQGSMASKDLPQQYHTPSSCQPRGLRPELNGMR